MRALPLHRRPESVSVAALLLVFCGALHLLVATVAGVAAAWSWVSVPWWAWGAAFVFYALGTGSLYVGAGVWHMVPGSRQAGVVLAVLSLLNVPVAWPFAGAALHALGRPSAREALPHRVRRAPESSVRGLEDR